MARNKTVHQLHNEAMKFAQRAIVLNERAFDKLKNGTK